MNTRYLKSGFIAILMLTIIGCQSFIDSEITSDLTNPENPFFVSPGVTFTLSFAPGDTITTNRPVISWTGSVFDSCEYTWTVDSIMFGEWSKDSTLILPTLDEGSHCLEVQTRYLNGVLAESNDSLHFEVDAIHGPGIRISPPYQELRSSPYAIFNISLEEVTNWSGGRFTLHWDAAELQIAHYSIIGGSDDFLLQNQSEIISEFTIFPDSLLLGVGLVDDLAYGISGSGAVATLTFQQIQPVDSAWIQFGECEFRNVANQSIPLEVKVSGVGIFWIR